MSVVFGCVIGADRKPIKGASVMFVRGPVALPDIALITDAAGEFALTAPVDGIYTVLVNAQGFPSVERQVRVSGKASTSIDIIVGGK
ncbi:carboxypeptidase-like regulatory domain-containing protein [Mesorhizobium sp. M0998]|uniref:carboxypeptidase-like regulatory domain-containing protein n=1 Tax=Mesorhizobium sp. M0998 TaxID=2957044 RepID=UPI00333B4D9A